MTISQELMYAILAMDSYHQGYDSTLAHGKNQIGGATKIVESSQVLVDENGQPIDEAASFYATAYDYEGGIVISYRGTDRGFSDFSDTGDVLNGYTLGAGGTSPIGESTGMLACALT